MPEDAAAIANPITTVKVDEELGRSYVNYAMSVIIARALPDVRDGLKPVQRRILYAMRTLNLTPDNAHTKCAKIAGETQANYHPHGQEVIYPTLVRMAQPWSLRYPLVDGQGNFGSVDGDSAAAMRYTEARMTAVAGEMLEDLDRETVNWTTTYLPPIIEPTVLPGKFPNLLCNGSQGIAVGMATNLPPHNLTEVCNAILRRIETPDCTLDDVMQDLPGPDFPTYGIIMGTKGLRSAYETGRGSIVLQARTMIEPAEAGKSTIVVTELPYQVNKTTLIQSIAKIAKEKRLDGILNVQDYSDKRGMRIEIDIRRDVNPNKALNYLLKHTNLRTTFGAILLSLVDGAPRTAPLLTMLDEYVKHRREVILRRTRYELFRSLEEVHLNEGYQIARRFLDDVVAVVRRSADPNVARAELVREFEMSPYQAQAVLNLPLRRLTQLEQLALETTYKEVLRRVHNLMDILNDNERLTGVMKDEIVALRDRHGDERRSKIQAREAGEFTDEDLIPEEEAIVSISRDGYIKRVSMDAYRQQRRGGKGVKSEMKADDEPAHLFQVSTHHTILFFTNRGRVYRLKGYEIPESGRYAKGMPVINYINIVGEERVTATVSVKDLNAEGNLAMITRGTGPKHVPEVKRTPLASFANLRNNGLIAFDIEEGDELGWALRTSGKDDIILVSRQGLSIRFNEADLKERSRGAGGVKAFTFKSSNPDDALVAAEVAEDDKQLLIVSELGMGKLTPMAAYKSQNRGGQGNLTFRITDKTGRVVGAQVVEDDDKLLITTTKGKGIRMKMKDIRVTGRVAQGVSLVRLAAGDEVAAIARLVKGADDGEGDDEDENESPEV